MYLLHALHFFLQVLQESSPVHIFPHLDSVAVAIGNYHHSSSLKYPMDYQSVVISCLTMKTISSLSVVNMTTVYVY